MICINTSSPEYKKLLQQSNLNEDILKAKIAMWQSKTKDFENMPSFEDIDDSANSVFAVMRSVKILSSSNASIIFAKGNANSWSLDKILKELQLPKEQRELILTLDKTTQSDIVTELLSKYTSQSSTQPTEVKEGSNVQTLKGKLDGSKLSEVEGKLEANKDRLIELLGSSMYSEKLKDVVYKELLQNAFDATKIAESKGLIDKGIIDIEINEKERIISFTDNGIGMTPDIVQKAFFTIGGTYKGEGVDNKLKSGGLGLAKMAFIFGSEKLILETVNNGIKTTVDATSQEIRTDNFKIKSEQTNQKNGTKVSVKIPETYVDSKGENRAIDFPKYIESEFAYSFLKNPLLGNVDINYSIINRESSYRKEEIIQTNLGKIPEGFILFSPAKTSFADMDIYVDTRNVNGEYDSEHKILSSGLYQFDHSFKKDDDEEIPLNIIIDIKPKVDATNAQYPFNNQRENFKPTVKTDIAALNKYLQLLWKNIELELLKSSFSKIKNIEAVDVENVDLSVISKNKEITKTFVSPSNSEIIKAVVDDFNNENQEAVITDGDLKTKKLSITKEEIGKDKEKKYGRTFEAEKEILIDKSTDFNLDSNKPIVHNNTTMQLDEKSIRFLSEISSIMIDYKKSIIDFFGEEYGALMKNQLWGVSIDKNYGGVNVNPSFLSMVAINPFYMFPTNAKVDAVNWIAVALDHLIIHELNHNFQRNEGAGFTGRFVLSYADIHSMPNHFELISKLKLSIKNNLQTIKKLNYEYEQSENVESGFEGNKIEDNNQRRADIGIKSISKNDSINNARTTNNDTRSSEKFGEIINSNILGNKQYIKGVKEFLINKDLQNQIEETEPKPIKEGVAEVFEQTPELVLIGTAQDYSDYLDTVFPDSQVKNIVYHGITSRLKEKFDKFSKEFIKSGQGRYGEDGFFFSENKDEVNKNYNSSGLITAIINLRNTSKDIYKNTWKETVEYLTEPQELYGGKTDLDYLSEGYRAAAWNKEGNWKKQLEKLKEDGWKIEETPTSFIKLGKISSQEKTYYSHLKKNLEKGTLPFNINNSVEAITKAKEQGLDGLVYENVLEESSIDKHNQYVVFEPEQIHILGGEEDQRMFKEHMDFKNNVKDYFNLNEKEATFVQDISNLKLNC